MTHRDELLPEKFSRASRGGPSWKVSIVRTAGGNEQRNKEWSIPKWRWEINHLAKTLAEADELNAFFLVVGGETDSFNFKDWLDYQATGTPLGTGDGATTQYQLKKRYTFGALSFDRTIYKIAASSLVVYVDGSPVTVNSVSATGLVTLAAAPGNGLAVTADFDFYAAVRFDMDWNPSSFQSVVARDFVNMALIEVSAAELS